MSGRDSTRHQAACLASSVVSLLSSIEQNGLMPVLRKASVTAFPCLMGLYRKTYLLPKACWVVTVGVAASPLKAFWQKVSFKVEFNSIKAILNIKYISLYSLDQYLLPLRFLYI